MPPYGGPPFTGPPFGGPPRRRRGLRIALAVLAVVGVLGAGGGIWAYLHHQNQERLAQIRDTVNGFAEASDTADAAEMASLMCDEEAAQFTDGMEGVDDGGPIEPEDRRPVDFGEISVEGDRATVEVTRPPAPQVTFTLKREGDAWLMCNPE